jgi:hypothetical protein
MFVQRIGRHGFDCVGVKVHCSVARIILVGYCQTMVL